jgi:hypothetical protein
MNIQDAERILQIEHKVDLLIQILQEKGIIPNPDQDSKPKTRVAH